MRFSFKHFALSAITLAFSISAASQYVAAAPGDLDTTFGTLGQLQDGMLSTIKGSVVQADGKIIAVGYKHNRGAVIRYNSDGSVDSSFGTQGLVLAASTSSYFFSVALQVDGKIVAAGRSDGNAFVVRLNSNGTFDTSFSGDGMLTISFATTFNHAELTEVATVPNSDKIVVAGTIYHDAVDYPCEEGSNLVLARINSTGALDPTFDGNGKKAIDLHCRDVLTSIAIHPTTEKIAFTTEGSGDFEVGMLNVDGSLDTSFGGDGLVETDFAGTTYQADRATSVAFQRWFVTVGGFPVWTTRLVVGGTAYGSSASVYDWALARYRLDGTLDTAFDGDGKVRTALSYQYESVEAIKIDSQQRIVTTGRRTWNGTNDFALVRFTRDGAYDTTFGNGGKVYTKFFKNGLHTSAVPYAVALDPDGKIVAAGSFAVDTGGLIARYLP